MIDPTNPTPTIPVPSPPLLSAPRAWLLHGIFGSAKNWRSFARRLYALAPGWQLELVDLRGHGETPDRPGPHTVAACVDDLLALAAIRPAPPVVVIGHSFGGRVAAAYASRRPPGLEAIWVLDTPPGVGDGPGDPRRLGVDTVLRVLRSVPQPVPTREAAAAHIRAAGLGDQVAGWMTTNLAPSRPDRGGGYRWRFDIDVLSDLLADYWARPMWPLLDETACPVHVLRAGRSDGWTEDDLDQLTEHSVVRLHELPGAGHWVHVDDPEGLATTLAAGLDAVRPG